jgi:hypothetical protein
MRAREMLRRLDRIAPDKKEWLLPDLSVLSPWEYDRIMDLWQNIRNLKPEEEQEFLILWEKCPLQTDQDKFKVPIKISRSLAHYWEYRNGVSGWRYYQFHRLRMVERERFLTLCARYGWEDGFSVKGRMAPLEQWDTDDQEEIQALLDLVDSRNEVRASTYY